MNSTERPKVVTTCWIHPETLAILDDKCDLVLNESRDALTPEELATRARDADALMVFMPDRVDEDLLERCERLKVVAGALKGSDNIDIEACTRRGIPVTVVPDLLTAPTAELALALMLALGRKVVSSDRFMREGTFTGWRPTFYGTGLDQSVVGIVGLGRVGQAIAQRVSGFGATMLGFDEQEANVSGVEQVPLTELLTASQFIVVALPLSRDTYHLLNPDRLALVKSNALLVNVGRGSVVDENAVLRALEEQRLGGYAADVFEMEDLSLEVRPRHIPDGLIKRVDQTVFTPHLGSAVTRVRKEIEAYAAREILQALFPIQ